MGDNTVVRIQHGLVKGKINEGYKNTTYYSFQSIPYAKPPIGPLRFLLPEPPEPWDYVKDATKEPSECYSRHPVLREMVGSEDCLYLNVFTPQLPKNDATGKKPVMFFVHGGGFNAGSSKTENYGPDFLVNNDVVVVTFNYRLGVLGFLSLEDPSLGVPGNLGLKDMVFALKWVQGNISAFGGDPDNVTIFGQSAGGCAIHFLVLSPMTKGLFHKAILQSGCALNSWAWGRRCGRDLAQYLGCENIPERQLLSMLKTLPVEKIFEAQESLKDVHDACEMRPHGPVVEPYVTDTTFLPDHPFNLISSGRYNMVPMMIGYMSREGMILDLYGKKTTGKIIFVNDFETTIPYTLNIARGSPISKVAAQRIKEFYYGHEEPSINNMASFYLLHTDNFFLKGIFDTIRSHVTTSTRPIFFYRFSAETELNVYKMLGSITWPGVCHADDMGYIFKNILTPEIRPGSIEEISIERVTKLLTNFARTGDPNPIGSGSLPNVVWKPVTKTHMNFLDIGENLTAGLNPDAHRIKFWDDIYSLLQSKAKL